MDGKNRWKWEEERNNYIKGDSNALFFYLLYIYLNSLKWQCQPSTPIGFVLADGVCHSSVNRSGNGKQVLRIKYANHQSLAWDVHDTIIFLE